MVAVVLILLLFGTLALMKKPSFGPQLLAHAHNLQNLVMPGQRHLVRRVQGVLVSYAVRYQVTLIEGFC